MNNLHIDSDYHITKYLDEFAVDYPVKCFRYIYRIAGYRCYMNLIDCRKEFYLEIYLACKKPKYLEWPYDAMRYIDIVENFGFSLERMDNLYLLRPIFGSNETFTKERENRLLEILLSETRRLSDKYGLI